jgi:hypothetical protein
MSESQLQVVLRLDVECGDGERNFEKIAPVLPSCVTWNKGTKVGAIDEWIEVESVIVTAEKIFVWLEAVNWTDRFTWVEIEQLVFNPENNGWKRINFRADHNE